MNVRGGRRECGCFFHDRIVLSIRELDALWYDKEKIHLAQGFKDRILTDIGQFKRDRSFVKIMKKIGEIVGNVVEKTPFVTRI